jgi:hypothetical protein
MLGNLLMHVLECPCKCRILLVLPKVRRGISDRSTSRISFLADRGVYEPYLIRATECREALPLGCWRTYLSFWCPYKEQEFYWNSCSTSFFYVENLKGIPVPVEKNRGNRNSTSPAPSTYMYVKNMIVQVVLF